VFAACDGNGNLDLWNLNNDLEVPAVRTCVDPDRALNRCRWSKDGRQIATGDSVGNVCVFDVRPEISVPRADENERFEQTMSSLGAL
jgi:hypothetical protein